MMLCGAASAAFWLAARAVLEHDGNGVDFRANQIAIVGNDGNVWLASQSQNELQRVTGDQRGYRFPTWSPDGKRLAFIGVDDQDRPTLYVTTGARRQPKIIYNDPSSAPFYIYSVSGWSVDFVPDAGSFGPFNAAGRC